MIKLFDGVVSHRFAENVCFLCGSSIIPGAGSVEHVFPRWLQKRFALWDVRMHLLNGTPIQYKNLVVPCCATCNNVHLSKIEREVSERVLGGPTEVASMDRLVLMQWLLKIFFGILYRELFLPLDRKQPHLQKIISPEDIEQFQMLHYILQSARVPMKFHSLGSALPASIFVFQVKAPAELKCQFHYRDDVIHRCLQIRIGEIGIIAAFDMGFQAVEGAEFFPKYFGRPLHPIQFDELAVSVFSKARKLTVNPLIMFSESPAGVVMDLVPPGRSPYAPMSTSEVGEMLAQFTGVPIEAIMPVPDQRITFLENDDGTFRDILLDEI